jgi:3-dehydroquinate dehydratase/shikimate dehydrogenase
MARICIPVCENNVASLISAADAASPRADLVELRLDCLSSDEFARLPLEQLQNSYLPNLIITLRDPNQGGHCNLSYQERANFWRQRFQQKGRALFDIELDLVKDLVSEGAVTDWSRVICSHHDFDGVPENLDEIYTQIAQTPAGTIKIAVRPNDVTDCLVLFRLIDRACADGRQIIAIAMGDAGAATRILGPSRGGFLTYGASQEDHSTAPGQLTAEELRELYRVEKINHNSAIYGLVGFPAMHSVSPHMHNAAFEHLQLDGVYIPFEVKDAVEFFKRMVHPRSRELQWNLQGLSITAPHKLTVMEILDSIDADALDIGAVNTIVVKDEKLLGYNTDAAGFLTPLQQCIDDLTDARVAVIGAGGAANAVMWSLCREEADITVFARDESKAANLAGRFGASYHKLDGCLFRNFDIVVNTTPLGSVGPLVDQTPANVDQLDGVSLVYDLVYNPNETLLLRNAHEAGCKALSGLQMLVAQAALQFQLWTGVSAPVDLMQAAASAALKQKMI